MSEEISGLDEKQQLSLVKLYEDMSTPITKIRERYGVSAHSIYKIIRLHGLTPRSVKYKKEHLKTKEHVPRDRISLPSVTPCVDEALAGKYQII